MPVLVAYASKHGATRQIAERIGEVLRATGLDAEVRPVHSAGDPAGYDAVVLGSAVYFGAWRREGTGYVRRHRGALSGRPVWLFSSGPLGTATADAQGRDLRAAAAPKELAEFTAAVAPRDHRVFFGALDHTRFGPAERLLWLLPGSHELLREGDFRDWTEVDAWAAGIAQQLAPRAAAQR